MKVKHKLWPVSYVDSNGDVVRTLYKHEPAGDDYHVGTPFEVEAEHPDGALDAQRRARIEALREELNTLQKTETKRVPKCTI